MVFYEKKHNDELFRKKILNAAKLVVPKGQIYDANLMLFSW
jgi:hypothetical protein